MSKVMMKCPATMCPLIAPEGSPWTGHKNASCKSDCGWFDRDKGRCSAAVSLYPEIDLVRENGTGLNVNPVGRKYHKRKPMHYDCERADDCKWQEQAKDLCPPRYALSLGLDPRVCLF